MIISSYKDNIILFKSHGKNPKKNPVKKSHKNVSVVIINYINIMIIVFTI